MKILENQQKIKWGITVMIIFFVISMIYFSRKIIEDIKEREIATIERFAKFLEYVSNTDTESLNYFADDILIENHTIPVIVTDEKNNIITHKNIYLKGNESNNIKVLQKVLLSMKKQYEPIKIFIYDDNGEIQNYQYVYYKNSEILEIIILAPYYLILLVLLILSSIYLIFYYSNMAEKDRLWTGLAKETAHQLGTPLSSLIGWNEYIKTKQNIDKDSVTSEIDKDLNRLKTITGRFSNIGSKPSLKKKDLKEVINNSLIYLKKRISKKIITEVEAESINYPYNEQLFSWVIENLYKNSVDAIGEDGKIIIKLFQSKNKIFIDFIDNGIGIKRSDFKKIFNAGYTSKKRGWGLGLALAQRIIKNYHKGKIYVLKSTKMSETIIRIELLK